MGNDGGVILKRKDLIKQKKPKNSLQYSESGKWLTCRLSNNELSIPIVSDYKGYLYNKDSILEFLLEKGAFSTKQTELAEHIKSPKDVVELHIYQDPETNQFVCPITGNTLGFGGLKYVYLVRCGDVFAEKCLKEINEQQKKCPLCNKEYDNLDVIILNPEQKQDIDILENRMLELNSKGLTHSLRKLKKPKKRKTEGSSKHLDEKRTKIQLTLE